MKAAYMKTNVTPIERLRWKPEMVNMARAKMRMSKRMKPNLTCGIIAISPLWKRTCKDGRHCVVYGRV